MSVAAVGMESWTKSAAFRLREKEVIKSGHKNPEQSLYFHPI